MNINDFLHNIINSSKNEKMIHLAKEWLEIENTTGGDIFYENVLQILSPNWECEILNDCCSI